MAFDKSKTFSYKIGDIDEAVDSRGNTVVYLRKLAWGDGKEKLEIRKWFIDVDKETPSKGVTFLTDEGPNNLINSLIKHGYGDTQEILTELSNREDFDECLANMGKKRPESDSCDQYLDPKSFYEEDFSKEA